MAEMRPLPDDPALPDLAKGLGQLHGCVEDHKRQTATGFAEMLASIGALTKAVGQIRTTQRGVSKRLTTEKRRTDQRFEALEARLTLIVDATGADKEHPTVAGMSQRKVITGGVIIAGLAAFPGIDALIKFLLPVLKTGLAYIGAH